MSRNDDKGMQPSSFRDRLNKVKDTPSAPASEPRQPLASAGPQVDQPSLAPAEHASPPPIQSRPPAAQEENLSLAPAQPSAPEPEFNIGHFGASTETTNTPVDLGGRASPAMEADGFQFFMGNREARKPNDNEIAEADLAADLNNALEAESSNSGSEDLDKAIDELLAEPVNAAADPAPAESSDFNPGSFGSIAESPISMDDFSTSNDAPVEPAASSQDEIISGLTAVAAELDTIPPVEPPLANTNIGAPPVTNGSTDQMNAEIGQWMTQAVKSIVYDEMRASVDAIARSAVRKALKDLNAGS